MLVPTVALMSSFGPCIALANLGSTLQCTFAAGNRVLDILDETPVVDEVKGQDAVVFSGAQAQNVTFSYGGETILDDISLDVPENAMVGIVGRSGSGKSTLLKLFMRFWAVRKGTVTLSGVDVGRINTANLRDMEGFVTQDTLSGGERQRLGLARAFLHGAPLMLLDEPTSNLDSLNEAVILRALGEERDRKTVILVSHQRSDKCPFTMKKCWICSA